MAEHRIIFAFYSLIYVFCQGAAAAGNDVDLKIMLFEGFEL
jgi:hypothetical protein